jgi:hypothetical protein
VLDPPGKFYKTNKIYIKMNTVHYDIHDFKWVKETNTFYGDGWDLYDAEGYYRQPFPNQRKQFIIKNYQTGNFRRFRFSHEISDPFGNEWVFESEDGIKCQIGID